MHSVLMSFGPDALTRDGNPFPALLVDSVSDRFEIKLFSWKLALVGQYDVLHLHWPEHLIAGRSRLRATRNHVLTLLLLLRLKALRKPVVMTAHNVEPHSELSRLSRFLVRFCRSVVTEWVVMNRSDARPGRNCTVIKHGMYPTANAPSGDLSEPPDDYLLFFGTLQRYKGIPELVRAYENVESDCRLLIAGKPHEPGIADEINAAVSHLPNVEFRPSQIGEEALHRLIRGARAVVLPYRRLTNSGALILALSLRTPVIAPETLSTLELREDFGSRSLLLYKGTINRQILGEMVGSIVMSKDIESDFPSDREWSFIGAQYMSVYDNAIRATGAAVHTQKEK